MKTASLISILVLSSCASSQLNRQAAELSQQVNDSHDKAIVQINTPYIAEAFTGDARKTTQKEICPGVKSCDPQMEEALHARWRSLYNGALWQSFMDHCKAYPADCRDLALFETNLRKAHNEAVEASRARNLAQIEANRQGIAAAQGQRNTAALGAFAGGAAAASSQAMPVPSAMKQTDLACMSQCQAAGMLYPFCQSKCSY